jgi:glycosyltransferase involved in cell wall biosynthesis
MLGLRPFQSTGRPFLLARHLMKISATIITLNERKHLARCLESLRNVADDVVVVDSGSEDETLNIAEQYQASTYVRAWTNYSEQKNYAASVAKYDWILSLDADECVSSHLRNALHNLKKHEADAAAFAFPRKAFYLGRWIEHCGWYPDYKIRLYRRDKARWTGAYVHESLHVEGLVVRLDGDLLHYTCESISEHLERLDRYTTLAASDLYQRGKRCRLWSLTGSPLAAFLKTYWLKQGFRDGVQGLVIACFAGYYNFAKHAKLWELEQGEAIRPGQCHGNSRR